MPNALAFEFDGLVRIGSNGTSAMLTLRRPFLEALKLKPGDTVLMRIVDEAIVVRPMQQLLELAVQQMQDRDRLAVRKALP